MKTTLPSIYEYNDFRKFIAAYYRAMHEQDRSYTKSHMSRLLGLPNSRSYLSDVLNGKHVSGAFVERFVRLFPFSANEANFFRVLVRFNQAATPNERELCFEQLIALNMTPKKYLYAQSYQYYRNWYHAAIRALLNIYDFNGRDFPALAAKLVPAITVPQAKQAVKLLLQLNLIEKTPAGLLKPTSNSISTEEFVRDEVLKQFQVNCLELAKRAILGTSPQRKVIATNTISISSHGLLRIEKQIDRFRAQVRSLVHKDENKPETVYQIDVLFFPLVK